MQSLLSLLAKVKCDINIKYKETNLMTDLAKSQHCSVKR